MRATIADRELLGSGPAARALGVSVETLRYWETKKLIAPPLRTASGRRLFRREDLELIRAQRAERDAARQTRGAA